MYCILGATKSRLGGGNRLAPVLTAAELFANVCVAHGTLCNDISVYPIFCNKPDGQKCRIYV